MRVAFWNAFYPLMVHRHHYDIDESVEVSDAVVWAVLIVVAIAVLACLAAFCWYAFLEDWVNEIAIRNMHKKKRKE